MNPGLHRAIREGEKGEIMQQQRVEVGPKEHDEEGVGCSSGVVAVVGAGAIVLLTLATVVVVILLR
jgi:hypothetical protein